MDAQPGSVVVGVDGSDRAADAVALGTLLARIGGARLELVSVYPQAAPELVREPLRKEASDALGAVEAAPGAAVEPVAGSSPAQGLHEHARGCGASLIVVGSSHHGRPARVLPGSTAERLLHGAPCAVAVAPRGFAESAPLHLRLIGCAYDAGPEAARALAVAEALARAGNARLRLIAVVEPVVLRSPYAAPVYEAVMTEQREWLERHVREALEGIGDDVGVDSAVVEGWAAQVLAERSAELDLLVCGSRGYGPLRAVLAGGVVGRVIREAACPVLVLPRGSTDLFQAAGDALAESRR